MIETPSRILVVDDEPSITEFVSYALTIRKQGRFTGKLRKIVIIMLLAIDIGNTHTVIGVYAGDSLRAMWRIATNRKAAADELRIVFSTLFSLESLDLSQVRASAVASVVPQLTKAWMQAIKDATGARSLVCNAETAEGLFDADYPKDRKSVV